MSINGNSRVITQGRKWNFTYFLLVSWKFLLTFAQILNCETWETCFWRDIMIKSTFNGYVLAPWVSKTLILIKILNCIFFYYFWPLLSWLTSANRKKIIEVKVWASTEVEPSNEIEIHKAKKDSKFNFILISDCLADIHGM